MNNYKLSIIIPTYNQADNIHIGLDSIPNDVRIETIVVDDGSTDQTFEFVCCYIDEHPDKEIKLFKLKENKGVSTALNKGLDEAAGEYVVFLGSDGDYFLPGKIEMALDYWLNQGVDLVYFDIIDNVRHVRKLSPKKIRHYPGAVKFMKRSFIGNTRNPVERRRAEDVVFNEELLKKKPKALFTHQVVKHYNYPRKGSLTWNARHGITDRIGNPIEDENS